MEPNMSKNKLFTIIISFINFSNIVFSQVTEVWTQRYNGPTNSVDYSKSITIDASGNIYVTGTSRSAAGDDYATIKYSPSGAQLWVKRYDGPGNAADNAIAIAVDQAGNIYVTGKSVGSGTADDYATIKYNSTGIQLWVQRYNGPVNQNDDARCLAVDAQGNVYVTGSSIAAGLYGDFTTIKYNTSGLVQWIQQYNGPANSSDAANSIVVDASGNVYVTGYSTGINTGDDITTIKYNSAGVLQWNKRYNGLGSGGDNGICVKVDVSGNVYVGAYSTGAVTNRDFTTIKYNSAGTQQWAQFYHGPANAADELNCMTLDASGNVYITGQSQGIGTNYDYATIKYNSSGILQWVKRYNGTGNTFDFAYCVASDATGGIYVTGGSTGIGTGQDYTTIKYNSSGIEQWVMNYNGPGNGGDAALGIIIDGSYNVYITGASY